ncbi:MAG: hypothetical protein JSV00_00955 [bacterium]|nr:MAG: hypothetical protein JSV00_00955 [bacterium]
MPQVFSAGWLYVFLIIMVISVVRIVLKLRQIRGGASMDRPLVRLARVEREKPDLGDGQEAPSELAETDNLIRDGKYSLAITRLKTMQDGLSPVEDREARGQVLYRLGACHRRAEAAGVGGLLRAGEALREAVTLFAPQRFAPWRLRALAELAGVYEDLSRHRDAAGNAALAARTFERAGEEAARRGQVSQESELRARAGVAYRRLAVHADRQANLRKAADAFEAAASASTGSGDEGAVLAGARMLKMLGDTSLELAELYQPKESLKRAMEAYGRVLEVVDGRGHPLERGMTLTDLGRAHLAAYDMAGDNGELRKAIQYLRDALQLLSGGEVTEHRGRAMALMADALVRYAEVKDRRENLQRSARLYEAALGMMKDGDRTDERERVRNRLAEVMERITTGSG